MARFENPEIAFEVPDDWQDESRTMFVFPEAETNISLTRRPADPAIPLREYMTALVRQMSARWPELEVIERGPVQLGDAVGEHVVVEWSGPKGRQRSMCRIVFHGTDLWSFTAMTPTGRLEETKEALDRAMTTFVAK